MENRLSKAHRGSFLWVLVISLVLSFLCSFPREASPAQEPDRFRLDADRISFEESSGVATAEGNVKIEGEGMRLTAPYVEYDSDGQKVRAMSSPEGAVVFSTVGRRLSGERLDYDFSTKRGAMTRPNGKIDAFYVKGDRIEVMPLSDVPGYRRRAKSDEEESAARWLGASVTTCNELHPHYRLEAKEIFAVQGRRVVIRRPKVYLGDRLLFAYPFDYVVPLKKKSKKERAALFPKIGYESSKGAGLGVRGPYVWDSGSLEVEGIAWSEGLWEGEARLVQEIAPGWRAYGVARRAYDKDRDVTLWRPEWGLEYEGKGWEFEIGWSQRKLLSLQKRSGIDTRYVIWRKPEIRVASPWYSDPAASGYFRLFGSWGRYEDVTEGGGKTVERAGAGVQIYGEFPYGGANVKPFYNATYWYYKYDDDLDDSQRILSAILGVRWRLASVNMQTAYLRRWTWGNSPMKWDDYDDREELYQRVAFRIPTNRYSKQEWLELAVRGAYSFDDEELSEMVYKASYNQHCLLWELIYRDDRVTDDDWIGLNLTITAYPESGLRLMDGELFDPCEVPDKLDIKRK